MFAFNNPPRSPFFVPLVLFLGCMRDVYFYHEVGMLISQRQKGLAALGALCSWLFRNNALVSLEFCGARIEALRCMKLNPGGKKIAIY